MGDHRPACPPAGPYCASSRPANYAELWEATQAFVPRYAADLDPIPGTWPAFEYAWSNFLHEFFLWRLADFFAVPPPEELGLERCVMLAGAAEYLCSRYNLEAPDWIDDSRYVLPALRDYWADVLPVSRDHLFRRCQRAEPEFLKRNLVFEALSLITHYR